MAATTCSPSGNEALPPTATLGPEPTTTAVAVEAPPDPSVIPDDPADIDEDYVQAVVDALFAVDAKATEIFVNTRELDEAGIAYLEAIYVPEELNRQVDIWSQDLDQRSEELLPGMLNNDVQRIIDVTSDCVYVAVRRDYSETTTRLSPGNDVYLGLTPKLKEDDPLAENSTAWMLFMDGLNPDGSQPENPCVDQ